MFLWAFFVKDTPFHVYFAQEKKKITRGESWSPSFPAPWGTVCVSSATPVLKEDLGLLAQLRTGAAQTPGATWASALYLSIYIYIIQDGRPRLHTHSVLSLFVLKTGEVEGRRGATATRTVPRIGQHWFIYKKIFFTDFLLEILNDDCLVMLACPPTTSRSPLRCGIVFLLCLLYHFTSIFLKWNHIFHF